MSPPIMYAFPDDVAQPNEQLRLLPESGRPIEARAEELESDIWDHVIRSKEDLPAPVAGVIPLTSGSWFLAASVNLGTDFLDVASGELVYLRAARGQAFTSSANQVLRVNASAEIYLEQITLVGATSRCVQTNVSAKVYAVAVNFSAVTACIYSLGFDELTIWGGTMSGAHGVYLQSTVSDYLMISGVHAFLSTYFIAKSAGTLQSVLVRVSVIHVPTVFNFNAPSRAISVVGNVLDATTVWSNPVFADPTVNDKANLGPAGLLSETPIVP